MSPSARVVTYWLIALAILTVACQQRQQESPSDAGRTAVAGNYVCAPDPPPNDPGWPGPEDWELKEDGSLTIGKAGKVNFRGTWTVEGNQVVVQINGKRTDRLNIEGGRLVVVTGPSPQGEGPFTCTKKTA